jgi:hypothetical protein
MQKAFTLLLNKGSVSFLIGRINSFDQYANSAVALITSSDRSRVNYAVRPGPVELSPRPLGFGLQGGEEGLRGRSGVWAGRWRG